MQIAQPKLVGIVHNDRIDISYVNTAFYNIGTNEHIVFPVNKIKNSFFKIMAFHLPMSITNGEIGTKTLDNIGHLCQAADAIEYEKDLASPFGFKIDGVADHVLIIYQHFSLYW